MEINEILSEEFWEDEGEVSFETSGTTGEGKRVLLSKRALRVSAEAVNAWLGVSAESVWGLALPVRHVGGFGVVARAAICGCELRIYEGKWNAGSFAEWVEREGVSHVSLVPTQVHDLVSGGFQGSEQLKAVVVGGGALDSRLGQAARNLGWPVLASYGMTEASSQVATQSLKCLEIPFAEGEMEILPIWQGRASENGLLEIKGEALFSGTMTGEEFVEREGEWFRTNDRVRVDGRHLFPLGRSDSLVKVMGELVDLEAVEREFLQTAGQRLTARDFAIIAVPDARREHTLLAVFRRGKSGDCYADFQKSVRGLHTLGGCLEVDEMPMGELGKVRRGELAKMVKELLAGEKSER